MFCALLLAGVVSAGVFEPTVKEELERIRVANNLPSITAGAIVAGKIVSLETVGFRHVGSDDRTTVEDQYHIGSNTKAFTAALIGLMVQRGKLTWDTPISQLLPDAASTMDPAFRKVTPRLLMAHRSGLSGETYIPGMPNWGASRASLPEQRAEYAKIMLSKPPLAEPETKYIYSNANFIILGAILENLTHRVWEDLVTTEILKPLGMRSAGFGAAGADGKSPQPWGHYIADGKLVGVPPGPRGDNLPILGPAGTLHMSTSDMLRWGAFQADEGRHGGLLTPATFEVLHSPIGEYGGGFLEIDRPWGDGKVLTHSGSNTMNYQTIWIAPKKQFAVVISTNAVVPEVGKAVDDACALLIRRYCPN